MDLDINPIYKNAFIILRGIGVRRSDLCLGNIKGNMLCINSDDEKTRKDKEIELTDIQVEFHIYNSKQQKIKKYRYDTNFNYTQNWFNNNKTTIEAFNAFKEILSDFQKDLNRDSKNINTQLMKSGINQY